MSAGPLDGFRVALDVQHLYRPLLPRDQGGVYLLADGSTVTEAHGTLIYAAAAQAALADLGAAVLTNSPPLRRLIGFYSDRNREATAWGAHLYLACHLNAGRGSYAAIEMMAGKRDDRLSGWIGSELVAAAPEILESRAVALAPMQRGDICIDRCGCPAAILEPFFGDNPRQQALLATPRLVEIGQAIARGVAGWWRGRSPVPGQGGPSPPATAAPVA